MTNSKLKIKITHHYFEGSVSPADGYLKDVYGNELDFGSVLRAVNYLAADLGEEIALSGDRDLQTTGNYFMQSGECDRPDYTIVSAATGRSNPEIRRELAEIMNTYYS